jgi:hypothetical protein
MLTAAVPEFTSPTNSSMVIGGSPTAWIVVDLGMKIAIALLPSFEPQKHPFGTLRISSGITFVLITLRVMFSLSQSERSTRNPEVVLAQALSTPGPFHLVAHSLKFRNDPIPMIALDLDPSLLNRSPGAKPCFQLGGKFCAAVLVQRQVGNGRHALASPALRLTAHSDDSGFARGRRLALASAGGFELVALGAGQVSPTMLCHRGSLFLLGDLRDDPILFHLLPQVGELGRRFAGRLSSLSSHCI